jgi:hypothetical protein
MRDTAMEWIAEQLSDADSPYRPEFKDVRVSELDTVLNSVA